MRYRNLPLGESVTIKLRALDRSRLCQGRDEGARVRRLGHAVSCPRHARSDAPAADSGAPGWLSLPAGATPVALLGSKVGRDCECGRRMTACTCASAKCWSRRAHRRAAC
eukprot:365800-Chlamydomonas_euryale.AAC.38